MPKKMQDIAGAVKKGVFLLRSDPELALQVRQLFLTLVIALACAYGAYVLLIQPRQETLNRRQGHVQELGKAATPGETELLTAHLQKLAKDIQGKEHTLAVLSLQEELLREQWSKQGSDERFHQVIFTLATSSPVDMQQDLLKMTQETPRSMEGFTMHPIHMEGQSYFENIFRYLSFLETSVEIGFLNQLELTVQSGDPAEKAQVDFKIDLGRLEIAHGI